MNFEIENFDVNEAVNTSAYIENVPVNYCTYHTTPLTSQGLPASDALKLLQEGNKRFITNKSILINNTQSAVSQIPTSQAPFAVVFGCSDSRVPPPVVFNRGVGEIFETRSAGEVLYNNLNTEQVAVQIQESVEFAVNSDILNSRLLLIMGHSDCGAVIYTQNYFNGYPVNGYPPTVPAEGPYSGIFNSLYNAYTGHNTNPVTQAPNKDTIPMVLAQAADIAKYLYINSTIIQSEVANKENPLQIWIAIYNDAANVIDGYSTSAGEVSNYRKMY